PTQPARRGAAPPAQRTAAPAASTGSVSTDEFVQDVATGTMFEIEAGKLAAQRAQRKDVKQFGQRMVKDHSAADKAFKAALKKAKNAPQPPAQMTAEQTRKLDELRGQNGPAFDTAYVSMMADDHEKDLDTFRTYAKTGDDPALKAFASKTQKVIDAHHKLVTKLEKK
ncbi:MAG: hypothetical protein JWN93_478, partial [Hyphomicrobiales bacterium]|nr:hypothetical protein [Hyphomicrobiales bacterium]